MRDVGPEGDDSGQRADGLEIDSHDLDISARLENVRVWCCVLHFRPCVFFGRRSKDTQHLLSEFGFLIFPRRSPELLPFDEYPGEDLRPAARSSAKIDYSADSLK